MTDEAGLGARREKTQAQVVICTIRLEHEGGIRIVELARDGEHLGVGEHVRIEHHARGIAGEAIRRKGVYLEDSDAAAHEGREFYPQNRLTQATNSVNIRLASGWLVQSRTCLRRGWAANP